jgi:hypothetical protein
MNKPAMECVFPPLDGSIRSIIEFADFNAQYNPHQPWMVYHALDKSGGTSSISFAQMVNSSHMIAHLVRPQREGPEREVIGLLLHADPAVFVPVILGILRAGFVVSNAILTLSYPFFSAADF